MRKKIFDKKIYFGYACINLTLKADNIRCNRTVRMKHFAGKYKNNLSHCVKLAANNLSDVEKIIKWNNSKNIFAFRISSGIFPLSVILFEKAPYYSLETFVFLMQTGIFFRYCMENNAFENSVIKIKKLTCNFDNFLSFHSQPYVNLNAKCKKIMFNSVLECYMQALILEKICSIDFCCIVFHLNRYDNLQHSIQRFLYVYSKLPGNLKKILRLENTERFGIETCFEVHDKCGINLVFDIFHNKCFELLHKKKQKSDLEIFRILNRTSASTEFIKLHFSEQDKTKRIGAHSQLIQCLPDLIDRFVFQNRVILIIESKQKELI